MPITTTPRATTQRTALSASPANGPSGTKARMIGSTTKDTSATIATPISAKVSTKAIRMSITPPRFCLPEIAFTPWISAPTPVRADQSATSVDIRLVQPSVLTFDTTSALTWLLSSL
jgi:hypothetical protein